MVLKDGNTIEFDKGENNIVMIEHPNSLMKKLVKISEREHIDELLYLWGEMNIYILKNGCWKFYKSIEKKNILQWDICPGNIYVLYCYGVDLFCIENGKIIINGNMYKKFTKEGVFIEVNPRLFGDDNMMYMNGIVYVNNVKVFSLRRLRPIEINDFDKEHVDHILSLVENEFGKYIPKIDID